MIRLYKERPTMRIPISAKIESSNKVFIELVRDSLNDFLLEIDVKNKLINFTETIELLIKTFSNNNPYILVISNDIDIVIEKYTVDDLIIKYADKCIENAINFCEDINNFFELLNKLSIEVSDPNGLLKQVLENLKLDKICISAELDKSRYKNLDVALNSIKSNIKSYLEQQSVQSSSRPKLNTCFGSNT